MSTLDGQLDRWVAAGLIDTTTAQRLREFETARAAPPAAVPGELAPAATPPPTEEPHRSSPLALVGEVLGYLGGVLVLSAVSFLLGRTWGDLGAGERVGIVAGLLAVVAVGGVLASRVRSDPAQRLASALLLATVAMSGWLAFVVFGAAGVDEAPLGVASLGPAAAVAAVVYALRPRALAQLVLLAASCGFLSTSIAAVLDSGDRPAATASGATLGALGVAWAVGAAADRIRPRGVGLVAGGLVAVIGVQVMAADVSPTWALSLAIVLALAMIATAITRDRLALLIVPGGLGLLFATPRLIDHLVGEATAVWLAVLVTGVALVGVAVGMVRARSRTP